MKTQYRPDTPSLLGSRLKVARAKEHLDELEPELRAYFEREPYRVADQPDVEDGWMVIRIIGVTEHPDPMWSVRVGELIHDLRSALDNLVWQLVLVNGKDPGEHNQFPIYTEPPKGRSRFFRKATRLDDMLAGVDPSAVATIKELQPYHGRHMHRQHRTALAWLATLSNIDKHRFVLPALGAKQQGDEPSFDHVSGPVPSDIYFVATIGPIYPGAEMFRWRVAGGGDDTKVDMEGKIPYDITFGSEHLTLSRLDWLQERIGQIVERFACAFPADPHKL